MRFRTVVVIFSAIFALTVLGSYGLAAWLERRPAPVKPEGPTIASDFALVDQDGRAVRDEDLRGRWQLVLLGSTARPESCSTMLAKVAAVLDGLGPAAERVQAMLITVDPERDRPAVLKSFLASCDPRILGLTGTVPQVEAALRGFGASSRHEQESGGYTIEHPAFAYLIDQDGRYAAHFAPEVPAEEMARRIRKRMGAAS
jgi:protein SCO1/2